MNGQKKLIKINEAHQLGIRGQDVKIAVMDTGIIDSPHYTVVDGIDCVKRNIFGFCQKRDVSNYPDDIHQHGTYIAHIIANGNFGIASDASLYDIRVVNNFDSDGDDIIDSREILDSSVISGIDWAIENDIDIIVMSLSGETTPSDKLFSKFMEAYQNGIRIFASAGNLNDQTEIQSTPKANTLSVFPCKNPYVSCVGGIVKYDNTIERTALFREDVDGNVTGRYASATGEEIDYVGADGKVKTMNGNNEPTDLEGTSFSTPYVAAVYALYLDYYDNLPKTQVDNIFRGNASRVDLELGYGENEPGRDWEYGFGYPVFLTKIKGNFDQN